MEVIKVENLCKSIKSKRIYNNINFTVNKGDCYGIIGADNEGKTSILHAILGLQSYNHGNITVFQSPTLTKQLRKQIAYVPDDLLCFPKMTGVQLLDMTMQLNKLTNCVDYAEELIEYFHINPSLLLDEMDESMNKCTYIISALLTKPDLLILDEPFNFLDTDSYERLILWLKNYCKSGKTVLLTNEDYDGIASVCTKLCVLKNGNLIRQDVQPQRYHKCKLLILENLTSPAPANPHLEQIQQEGEQCWFVYRGSSQELKQLLLQLTFTDFSVEDITVEEQLFLSYEWMEGKFS